MKRDIIFGVQSAKKKKLKNGKNKEFQFPGIKNTRQS